MKGCAHANRLSGVDFSSKEPPLLLANDGFNHDRRTRAILVFERPAGSLRVAKWCGSYSGLWLRRKNFTALPAAILWRSSSGTSFI